LGSRPFWRRAGGRWGILDARIAEQARRVAGIEAQDREIADAVAKLTAAGKAKSAIAATEAQWARRAAIANSRETRRDPTVRSQSSCLRFYRTIPSGARFAFDAFI